VPDLLVLGDVNPDLVLAADDPVPAFGQAERLIDDARLTIGGSGAITACGAARLGVDTALAGVVGDDLFGAFMTTALRDRGVDVAAVTVASDRATGLTVVLAAPDDRAMLTFPGTCADLTCDDVAAELLASVSHVHVSAYFLQTALAPGLPDLFRRAHAVGATTSIDPNWDPAQRWDGGLTALLADTDLFLPNEEEVTRIAGVGDVSEAAVALARTGATVIVKRGGKGALAARADGSPVTVETLPGIVPVDTVGAGDSFNAGVIAATLAGAGLNDALALGCACGALSTQAAGGTDGQPTRTAADELGATRSAQR
jgi:sugar/nucleoside kinase (ribokinase family)